VTEQGDTSAYQKMTFEQLVALLEELTARMASDDVGIEEAAELYDRAVVLHRLAAARLEQVQARIEGLGAGEPGRPAQAD
jgi:exodeoxyribonuclease VII small subunit